MKCDVYGCTWEGSQIWQHKAKIHGATKATKNNHMKAIVIAQMIESNIGVMSIEDLTFIRNQIDSAISVMKIIDEKRKQHHKQIMERIDRIMEEKHADSIYRSA